MIRFVDIRNQGTGYRFTFWNTVINQFVKIGTVFAWENWNDFLSYVGSLDSEEMDRYKSLCPEWVFNNDEDDLEAWCAGEIDSPYETIKELETKIEQMKTDHALEQLDRNMAKDRNDI